MKHAIVHLKLLVVAAIWGISWVAGRVIALEVPPITAAIIIQIDRILA